MQYLIPLEEEELKLIENALYDFAADMDILHMCGGKPFTHLAMDLEERFNKAKEANNVLELQGGSKG